MTPAHLAAYYGKSETLRFLCEHNAAINSLDNDGTCVAAILSSILYNPSIARVRANLHAVPLTLGLKAVRFDFLAHTPLHYACLQGHFECVSVLLERDVNWQSEKENPFGPLHCAAYVCDHVLVSCSWNRTNTFLYASFLCSYAGHAGCLELLFEETQEDEDDDSETTRTTLKIDAVDEFGRSAIFVATVRKMEQCVQLLVEAGLDASVPNSKGQTRTCQCLG
jgi:ankyrin repeat protein